MTYYYGSYGHFGWGGYGGYGGYGGHSSYNNTKTYEFTAFTEADLLQGSNGKSIGCGDVFTMPCGATTCITVKDDDKKLSGDACRDEKGDDSSYQKAEIVVGDEKIAEDVKIFAEQYHVLKGSDGQTYYLIEIEMKYGDAPGKGDDFFTFYGDVPPEGVELKVVNTKNVTSDWIKYEHLGAGEKSFKQDDDCDDCRYVLEAEDMTLYGYDKEYNKAASGDKLIKLKKDVGYAKADFAGEDGTYDIEICYVDENDGEGFIDIFINGDFVGCIDLSANNNGNGSDKTTFSSFKLENIELKQGDDIKLKGRQDGCEYARIDKIVFDKCDENEKPEPVADEACVCSDESVTISVLANDTDPNGDALSIAAIIDAGADGVVGTGDDIQTAVSDGDSVTLTSGAVVTLNGDDLVYDLSGVDDFDSLLVTESGADQFGYVADDGNGGSASTTVDVEVKGAVNTLETIAADLPTTLTFTVTNEAELDATSTEAFTLTLSSSDPRFDGLVLDEAYCLSLSENLEPGVVVEANVFIADAASVPAGALDQTYLDDNNDLISARDMLDEINWLINQDFGSQDNGDSVDGGDRPGETYTDAEIQAAIWALTDFQAFTLGTIPDSGTFENAIEIYEAALANGDGFVPGEGDLVGLFLEPTADSSAATGHFQPFIIGVPFEDLSKDCLCI